MPPRKPKAKKKHPAKHRRHGKPKLTAVGDILQDLVKDTPLGESLEQARIWEQWEIIAGPRLAEHGRPVAIQDKKLRIEVDSTVWMNRYAFGKWGIIRRANGIAKKELVNDIFLLLMDEEEE